MPHTFEEIPSEIASEELAHYMRKLRIKTVEDAAKKGRTYWIEHFARENGLETDLDALLSDIGLSWDEAKDHGPFKVDSFEMEISVKLSNVLQKEGIEVFADLFKRDRAFWQEKIASSDYNFLELGDAIKHFGLDW